MTSGFGAGVQLQGLNPDYTIILINGEPLVGRTAGVLDLNRIALGNIKKIENSRNLVSIYLNLLGTSFIFATQKLQKTITKWNKQSNSENVYRRFFRN